MTSRPNHNARRQRKQSHIYSSSLLPSLDSDSASSSSAHPSPLIQIFDAPPEGTEQQMGHLALDDTGGHSSRALGFSSIRGDGESDTSAAVSDPVPPDPLKDPTVNIPGSLPAHTDPSPGGHVRSPVLTREPTMLENFSRAVRNYVPSSIPIPNAAPIPPRVSRPLSFGSFMTSSGMSRRNSRSGQDTEGQVWRQDLGLAEVDEAVFGSDDEDEHQFGTVRPSTAYPSVGEDEVIVWARWDDGGSDENEPRRLLILGYATGVQIWDCTRIASVREVLNLNGSEWQNVTFAAIIAPPDSLQSEVFASDGPLLGMVQGTSSEASFVIYSLSQHIVVKRIHFLNLISFASNASFIVISTTNPATLHVLSSSSLSVIFTIPSTSLIPTFIQSRSLGSNYSSNSPLSASTVTNPATALQPPLQDQPVYALSGRLLAYACCPPSPEVSVNTPANLPRTQDGVTLGNSIFSEVDFGSAALKVGGSVFNGAKFLGGMALSAAKSRTAGLAGLLTTPRPGTERNQSDRSSDMTSYTFFSKSAPAGGAGPSGRRPSITSTAGGIPSSAGYDQDDVSVQTSESLRQLPSPTSPSKSSSGYYVQVLDLAPLSSGASEPSIVTQFVASKRQPIHTLTFSVDGVTLAVSSRDGQVVRSFQLRTFPTAFNYPANSHNHWRTESRSHADSAKSNAQIGSSIANPYEAPWHTYNLRRGRTSAVIEDIVFAKDGRWVAVGSRKRTIHLFAINPYGGLPDERSHMEGKVRSYQELQPLSSEGTPLVRLRATTTAAPGQLRVPLVSTFVRASDAHLPPNLLPPPSPQSSEHSSLRSSPSQHPEPLSPVRLRRPRNFQDLLVFDPIDGTLSLRRCFVEVRAQDPNVATSPRSRGATSSSLPTSSAGHTRLSPSAIINKHPKKPSSSRTAKEQSSQLCGKESVIATWTLKRARDWSEVKGTLWHVPDDRKIKFTQFTNFLAEAELSTFSRSTRVLPRTLYLSHQFSFHTLGEDYHALIRRYQFDVPGSKLDVRKEVKVNALAETGELFIDGFSADNTHYTSSSFDEPLASAITAGLDYEPTPSLPMLPNGLPNARPNVFRSPIPIRVMASGISGGVNESLNRFRREASKARSLHSSARSDGSIPAVVPLEFADEDVEILNPGDQVTDGEDTTISRTNSCTTSQGASVSTPSTQARPLDDADDDWNGWSAEDSQAVNDLERFDDISVVGFLDEEHAQMLAAERVRSNPSGKKRV